MSVQQSATIDWPALTPWTDDTLYTRSYIVDQSHPSANDTNQGTSSAPLRTIQAALDRVQPSEEIVVASGLYREHLKPRQGGTSTHAMIRLRAAPQAEVIVSGAEPLRGRWHRPRPQDAADALDQPSIPGSLLALSQRVWVVDLDEAFRVEVGNNYTLPNVTPDDQVLMPWMDPVSGLTPFTLKRAMLFQGDNRLLQLSNPDDVPRIPGSFFIKEDGSQLLVHPHALSDAGYVNSLAKAKAGKAQATKSAISNHHDFELAVRPHNLSAHGVEINFFSIQGLRFTRCANGFLRMGAAALCNSGGHHWRVEHCVVDHVNSAGIECSDRACEGLDRGHPLHAHIGEGHNIIAHNRIEHCGTAGIRSHNFSHGFACYNTIRYCGWQEAEYYYECAGIKLLLTRHSLISHNRIAEMNGGCGIWIDWDNRYAQVTHNVCYRINGMQGGIFLEASNQPNLVSHNLIWQSSGFGLFGGDSRGQYYQYNLIAHTDTAGLMLMCHTQRKLRGELVQCVDIIDQNVFYHCAELEIKQQPNELTNNLLISHDTSGIITCDGDHVTWSLPPEWPQNCGPDWLVGCSGSFQVGFSPSP